MIFLSFLCVNQRVMVCGVVWNMWKMTKKSQNVRHVPSLWGWAESWSRPWINMEWRAEMVHSIKMEKWEEGDPDNRQRTQAVEARPKTFIHKCQETGMIQQRPRPGRKRKLSDANSEEGNEETKHWIIGANYFTEPFQSKYRESTKLEKTQWMVGFPGIIVISSILRA